MKLELKHASAYLRYDVKVYDIGTNKLFSTHLNLKNIEYLVENIAKDSFLKLELRPLSDLTKEIEHNGEKFVPIEFLAGRYNSECGEFLYRFKNNLSNIEDAPYTIINKLLEWHFDVFGLIEKDLAVDINTLKK